MWGAFLGAGLAAGIGAGASAWGQSSANRQNRDMAREQMRFQERMSGTAHQREVADLRKAGLNPILSVSRGSSSPGGAMPNIKSIAEGSASSAMSAPRLAADLASIKANTQLSKAALPGAMANSAIAEAGAYSAVNRMNAEAKNPEMYGKADAILRRLGLGVSPKGVSIRTGGR